MTSNRARFLRRLASWLVTLAATLPLPARAANLLWTGSGTNLWDTDPARTNWSNVGTPSAFTDGDIVTFDDTGTNRTITIIGSVQPGSVQFNNSSSKLYALRYGTNAGTGSFTVGGGGRVDLGIAGDTPLGLPGRDWSGGTVITNGSTLRYNYGGLGNGPYYLWLGTNTVTLNRGTLHLNFGGSSWGSTETLSNNVVIGTEGGSLNLGPDANGTRRAAVTFTGSLTLNGDFGLLGDGFANDCINSPTFLATTLSTNIVVSNMFTQSGGAPAVIFRTMAGPWALTLTNGPFQFYGGGGANFDITNLVSHSSLTLYTTNNANDFLSVLRSNGGNVTLADNRTLTLGRGTWTPADFVFGTNVTVAMLLGGQNGTAKFMDTIVFGTNPGQPRRVTWTLSQNEYLAANTGKTLVFTNGGALTITSPNQPARIDGNIRFTDGSTLSLTWGNNNVFQRAGGTFLLGDGVQATEETIRIVGLMTADNSVQVCEIDYPSANISDDGNVWLRYESSTTAAARPFNLSWNFETFRGGSAGTLFAPYSGNQGLAVVGPAAGTVFTATNRCLVVTPGVVGFYNASGASRGSLGELKASATGDLQITNPAARIVAATLTVDGGKAGGIGTLNINNATFTNGGRYEVFLTNSPSTACGLLSVTSTLAFAPGTAVLATPTHGFTPAPGDFWVIATASAIPDVPSAPPGYSIEKIGNELRLTKLESDGLRPVAENRPVTAVGPGSATLNGFLADTGAAPTTVIAYWGMTDGDTNAAAWEATNQFDGAQSVGPLATNILFGPDTEYYYRFRATNSHGDDWANASGYLISGEVMIRSATNADEVGPVTGRFEVIRHESLTNSALSVYYAVGGSASNGLDYAALTGAVTIAAGASNAWIDVIPLADPLKEGTETIALALVAGPYVINVSSNASLDIADYPARHLTWTDGAATHQWDTNDLNWSDGSATAFRSGDDADFAGAAPGTIDIDAAGVAPADTIFSSGSYALRFGSLSGGGKVILTGSGTQDFWADGANRTIATQTGGTILSNGTLRIIHETIGGLTYGFGGGPILLDGGTLRLRFTGYTWSSTHTFTQAFVVGSSGGTMDFTTMQGNQNRAAYDLSGPGLLDGPLTVTANGLGDTAPGGTTYSGKLTLTGDRTIFNTTSNAATAVALANVYGPTRTLTLRDGSFALAGVGSTNFDIGNLQASNSVTIGSTANENTLDYLSRLRANGGKLTLGADANLYLHRGVYKLGDFIFEGSNKILQAHVQGSQSHRVTLHTVDTNDLLIAAGAPIRRLSWSHGQNTDVEIRQSNGTSLARLRLGNGGVFHHINSNGGAYLYANLLFLDGSTWDCAASSSKITFNEGTLTLGTGTPTTVIFNGYNGSSVFSIAGSVTDAGSVTLRYVGQNAGFGLTWNDGAFRGGSAATEFRPAQGQTFTARGPVGGTVFTASAPARFQTAGTNAFRLSGGALGGLEIAATGGIHMEAPATILASNVTFRSGSTFISFIAGADSNQCSRLIDHGTLTFESNVTVGGSITNDFDGRGGPWIVATYTALSGLPRAQAGYSVTPQGNRLLLAKSAPGTVFIVH